MEHKNLPIQNNSVEKLKVQVFDERKQEQSKKNCEAIDREYKQKLKSCLILWQEEDQSFA